MNEIQKYSLLKKLFDRETGQSPESIKIGQRSIQQSKIYKQALKRRKQ
jgi:hypothetical protein